MIGSARSRRAVAASALAAMLALAASSGAQTPPQLRTEYVPAEALVEHARGLLPLKREQFDRLLKIASQKGTAAPPVKFHIDEIVYRARLTENQRLTGAATVTIKGHHDEPSLLPLDPLNLTLQTAHWANDSQNPPTIGRDATGKLFCLVPEEGALILDASLAADAWASYESTFVLRLPSALRRRVELLLPRAARVSASAGILQQFGPGADSSEQRWTLDFGPESEIRVTIQHSEPDALDLPLLIARETSRYSLLPACLDVQASFAIDALEEPRSAVTFVLDAPLTLTSVRLGQRELAWRPAANAPSGRSAVSCVLPRPLAGAGEQLEVEATADGALPTGSKLPRIALAGAQLQEARVTVQAPPWMRLSARPTGQAAKTQFSVSSGAARQESSEFLIFGESGGVEVAFEEADRPLIEHSATHLTIEQNQVLGHFIGELKSRGENIFAIAAEVPRQWVVDSVETEPSDMLLERQLGARGSGPQRMQLALARPITAERPIRLIVRAHFRRPANLQMRGQGGLALTTFPAAAQRRRLLNLRVHDPQAELRLDGDATLDRLDSETLDAADRSLLDDQGVGLLFNLDSAGDGFRAGLRPAVPRYRADLTLAARVERDTIEQICSIRCYPEGTSLGSIAVRLAPAPRGRVQWRSTGDETRELSAVTEAANPGEAIYRVALPRASSSPVVISGTWTGSRDEPLSLVGLPEANQQTAIAEIRSEIGPVAVDFRGARPLPPSLASGPADRPVARYSYDAGERPLITVQPRSGETAPWSAWVEALEVTTFLAQGQTLESTAVLTVHNAGAAQFRIDLPDSVADCRLVASAGETIVRRGPGGAFEIPLPPGERTTTIKLRYSVIDGVTGWPIARLSVPLPSANLPVLRRVWTISMPKSYAPCSNVRRQHAEQPLAGAAGAAESWPVNWRDFTTGPRIALRAASFTGPAPSAHEEASFRGWRVYRRDLAQGELATMAVFRPAEFIVWSLSVFLLVATVFGRLPRARMLLIAAGGLLIAATPLVAPPISWLLLAAGLGLWCALFLSGPRINSCNAEIAAAAVPRSTAVIAAFLAFAWLAIANQAIAEPPVPLPAGRAVVPVNDQQQIAGEYVYLEPRLYEALHLAAAGTDVTAPKWLIGRANYELLPASEQAVHGARIINASFEIHCFQEDTTIDLPLARSEFFLVQGQSRLDDEPAMLRWDADGRSLLIPLARPGKHKLRLALAAAIDQRSGQDPVRFKVPAAAIATFSANGQKGAPLSDPALLPLPSVSAAASPAPADALVVEQYQWWKIRPAALVLESQFRLRRTTPIDQVSISVDPRLRPLANAQSGPDFHMEADSGSASTYTIYITEPADEIVVRLAWLWPGPAGVGKLILPEVRAASGSIEQDLAAVSFDPTLELVPSSAPVDPALIQRFADSWPDEQTAPNAVFDLKKLARRLTIDVRPTASPPLAAQTTDWSISLSQAAAQCKIDLTGVAAHHFGHRLKLPPRFVVSDVAVQQNGHAARVRWRQQADGALHVALLEAPQPEHSITVRGELPQDRNAKSLSLPPITLQSAQAAISRTRIFRQPDIQLLVKAGPDWKPAAGSAAGRLVRGLGRLVADLSLDPSVEQAELAVERTPNRPQTTGTTLTQVSQVDGDWRCDLDLKLSITGGVLDQVRLLVPAAWMDELQIDPPMEHWFEPAMSEDQRLLRLEPPQPLAGEATLRLSGPLSFTGGGVQVPNLQLLDASSVQRQLLLADGRAEQTIDWELVGLTRMRPITTDRTSRTGQDDRVLYRVTGPQFRAIARYKPTETKSAAALLLEMDTVLSDLGGAVTTARLVLRPASAERISFELPPHCRLLQVLVDGAAMETERLGVRMWQLPPASDVLPFEITIAYESPVTPEAPNQSLALAVPRFPGLILPAALWTVRPAGGDTAPPPELAITASDLGIEEYDVPSAELVRLQACAQALEAVQSARTASLPAPAISEAFARWDDRAKSADRRLEKLARPSTTPALAAARRAALDSISAARQRLFQAEILTEDAPPERGALEQRPVFAVVTFLVPGGTLYLRSSQPPRSSSSNTIPWLLAGSLAVAALGLGQGARSTAFTAWLSTHRPAAVAMGGFAWWLLAPLGWLGWIAVAAAGWLTAQRAWNQSRARRSSQ